MNSVDETIIRDKITKLLEKEWDKGSFESFDGYVSEETFFLMANAATMVLVAIQNQNDFLRREGYLNNKN